MLMKPELCKKENVEDAVYTVHGSFIYSTCFKDFAEIEGLRNVKPVLEVCRTWVGTIFRAYRKIVYTRNAP